LHLFGFVNSSLQMKNFSPSLSLLPFITTLYYRQDKCLLFWKWNCHHNLALQLYTNIYPRMKACNMNQRQILYAGCGV